MAKQNVARRAGGHDDEIPQRPKRSMVVRVGIAIVGLAVLISSLVPLMSMFERKPSAPQQSAAQAHAGAFAALEEAVRLNPKDAEVHVLLANSYYDAHRYADAANVYQKALALKPGDPNVQVDYGTSLFYSGRPEAALKEYRAVVKSNPTHFNVHVNMGVVLKSQGKIDEAVTSWKRAESVAPNPQMKEQIAKMITEAAVSTLAK